MRKVGKAVSGRNRKLLPIIQARIKEASFPMHLQIGDERIPVSHRSPTCPCRKCQDWRHVIDWGQKLGILNCFPCSMTCPHCHSPQTSRLNGTTDLGYPVFRCRVCRRKFNERTGTPFNHLEFPTDIVFQVLFCRFRYKLSLRNLAELFLLRGFEFTYQAVQEWEARFALFLDLSELPDGLVARLSSAEGHHPFHIAQTQGKVEVQPYALGDDPFRKPVTAVRVHSYLHPW